MTLADFIKTDKESVKWFILYPSGHEGPYSLDQLKQLYEDKIVGPSLKVWAEGLDHPVSIKILFHVVHEGQESTSSEPELPDLPSDEMGPPPLPMMDEQTSIVPPMEEIEEVTEVKEKTERSVNRLFVLAAVVSFLVGFGLYQWVKAQESFQMRRYPKMSMEQYKKIEEIHRFDGWAKEIFFKEYVSTDLSRIWLVTSGFQRCDVEATFTSIKEKLLSAKDEEIQFRSRSVLDQHVVEFSQFEFVSGHKIIPGLYEMNVEAKNCQWSGWSARVANLMLSPDSFYKGRMKVVIYGKGPEEFNQVLEKLIRKKIEVEVAEQNQEELFWQDVQQKFQTLLAISLQIEQHFLDLMSKDARQFSQNLTPSIDKYTKKYGHFLTSFVVENEKYFQEISKKKIKQNENKSSYEAILRMSAKRIGNESMKVIEEFQAKKKGMKRSQLVELEKKLKQTFKNIKSDLNQKIIQTSEDRARKS